MRIAGLVLTLIVLTVVAYGVYVAFLAGGFVFLATMIAVVVGLAAATMVFGKRHERRKHENQESAALAKMSTREEYDAREDDDQREESGVRD